MIYKERRMIDEEMEKFLVFFYGPNWTLEDPDKLVAMVESLNNTVAWQ